jgi:Predicted membrane protein (DUF2207)
MHADAFGNHGRRQRHEHNRHRQPVPHQPSVIGRPVVVTRSQGDQNHSGEHHHISPSFPRIQKHHSPRVPPHLLKAPTLFGRRLMDQVEGFRMFLGAVDGHRLNRIPVPEQTTEPFERFLPYAMALDLEKHWTEKFSGVITSAGAAAGTSLTAYTPSFYSGCFVKWLRRSRFYHCAGQFPRVRHLFFCNCTGLRGRVRRRGFGRRWGRWRRRRLVTRTAIRLKRCDSLYPEGIASRPHYFIFCFAVGTDSRSLYLFCQAGCTYHTHSTLTFCATKDFLHIPPSVA